MLINAKFNDPRPLINVCGRGGFVRKLLRHFLDEGHHRHIAVYAGQVLAGNIPLSPAAVRDALDVLDGVGLGMDPISRGSVEQARRDFRQALSRHNAK